MVFLIVPFSPKSQPFGFPGMRQNGNQITRVFYIILYLWSNIDSSADTTASMSSDQVVKKVKVSEDVFFTSRVFVSSRSYIHQEECEGNQLQLVL